MSILRPFLGSAAGGGGGNANVGALLRQSDDSGLGLFISSSQARLNWHLRGVMRETAEASTPSTATYLTSSSPTLELVFRDAADTLHKRFTRTSGGTPLDPEEINELILNHIEYPVPVDEVKAHADYGDLRATSATDGAGGNDDRIEVTAGTPAVVDTNATATILGTNSAEIIVTSPDIGGDENPMAASTSATSTSFPLTFTYHEVSTEGNGFTVEVRGGNNPNLSRDPGYIITPVYSDNDRKLTVNVDCWSSASQRGVPLSEIVDAVNMARSSEGEQLIVASTTNGSVQLTIFRTNNGGIILPLNNSGVLEGGTNPGGGGAITNKGEVKVVSGNPSLPGAGASGVINIAPPGDTPVQIRVTYTGTSVGAAGNSRVANVSYDGSYDANTFDVTGSHTDGDIEILFGAGTITIAAILTDLNGELARSGGGTSGFFTTAEVISNDDGVTTVTWGSSDSAHHTTTFSGGVDAGTAEPLSAEFDGTENRLTVTALATHTMQQIHDAIIALDDFQTDADDANRNETAGDVVIIGASASETITVDATVGNEIDYDFAGGTDGAPRTDFSVTSASDNDGDGNLLTITGVINTDTVQDAIDAYSGSDFTLTSKSSDTTTTLLGTALSITSLTGGVTQVRRQNPTVRLTSTGYTIRYHGPNTPGAQRTTLNEMRVAWGSIRHGTETPLSPIINLSGAGTGAVASAPTAPTGGSDYEAADLLEAIIRPDDQDHGPNIEIRYDDTEDTLEDIVDALTAQGIVNIIEVYGTDLTLSPEPPGFERSMFQGGGTGTGGGLSTVATDTTITGDGSAGDPLVVANPFTDADETKLDGIEANATADQSNAEIKTAYEANADTNALTNALKSKLDGIEANAKDDQTASEIKSLYESNSDTNAFTDTLKTKLEGLSADGGDSTTGVLERVERVSFTGKTTDFTTDQTLSPNGRAVVTGSGGNEIITAHSAGSNSFDLKPGVYGFRLTAAYRTSTGGEIAWPQIIKAGASDVYGSGGKIIGEGPGFSEQVTSGVLRIAGTTNQSCGLELVLNDGTWRMRSITLEIFRFGGGGSSGSTSGLTSVSSDSTLTGDGTSGSTLKVANPFTDADESKLDAIEANATADQTGAEIKSAYEAEADTNAFTDALKTKLDNVEANATADQSNAEIKTAYEANSDTNALTNALKTKLDNIEANATADQTGAEIVGLLEGLSGNSRLQYSAIRGGPSGTGTATEIDGADYTFLFYYNSNQAVKTNFDNIRLGATLYITKSGETTISAQLRGKYRSGNNMLLAFNTADFPKSSGWSVRIDSAVGQVFFSLVTYESDISDVNGNGDFGVAAGFATDIINASLSAGTLTLVKLDGRNISVDLGIPDTPDAPAASSSRTRYALQVDTDGTKTWVALTTTGGLAADTYLVGWSDATQPTQGEADNWASFDGFVLTIPSEASNSYLGFAIPASHSDPVSVLVDGNNDNQLSAYTKRTNITIGGTDHKVWTTDELINASIMGTGSRTITLGF